MIFAYRGRKLNISDQMMADYKYVTGFDLKEKNIDIYVHNKYIRSNPDPLSLVPTLSDSELLDIVKKGMMLEISTGLDIDGRYD